MATSLADQGVIAEDSAWQSRVKQAVMLAATQIMGEAKDTKGAVEWVKRQDLAAAVLRSDGQKLMTFYHMIVAHIAPDPSTTDHTTISDTDITNAVTATWGDVANVREEDLVA